MKKNRISIFTICCIGITISAFSQNAQLMSFDEALQLSRQNNHGIKQAQAQYNEKVQNEKAQKGLYMPKVGISANYVIMSDPLHMDLSPVQDAIVPLYETLGNYGDFSGVPTGNPSMPYLSDDMSTAVVREKLLTGKEQLEAANWDMIIQENKFGTLDATFQWILYAGGKVRAANKVAQLQKDESQFQITQKEGELVCNLVQQYYGLCLAQQATLVRKEVLNGMTQHVSDSKKMMTEGLISEAEYLHANMAKADAEREYTKALYTESLLQSALRNTIADQTISNSIQAISNLFILDTIQPLHYFLQLAESKNPMLSQIQLKYEQAYQGYKVERANYLPAIAAMGTYDIANIDLSPMVPDWMVGVGLTWTLFDGTTRYHKTQSAKIKTVQVDEYYKDAVGNINLMIEKTYNELQINMDQIESLRASEDFAKEYVRIQEKAYYEGVINSSDLIDARLNYAKVKIEELRAMYDFDVNLAILLHYTGIANDFTKYKQN